MLRCPVPFAGGVVNKTDKIVSDLVKRDVIPEEIRTRFTDAYGGGHLGEYFNSEDVAELKGKDLVCWCSPLPCHADFLLEMANR